MNWRIWGLFVYQKLSAPAVKKPASTLAEAWQQTTEKLSVSTSVDSYWYSHDYYKALRFCRKCGVEEEIILAQKLWCRVR